jgi:hypothetical protein
MSGAASHLAAYINSLTPVLSLSFDENDRPIYGTGGCGTLCDDCDPGFVSRTAYSSLSVPADSLRFYFLCTGGARIPFNEFANSQGFWYLATHEDCQPDMPALSVSGGNNSFFQFIFLLPTELESPAVCDFSEGVPEDFEIPVVSHFATWDLPYSSVRGFGNTGSYSGTGGTISVSFANPLP